MTLSVVFGLFFLVVLAVLTFNLCSMVLAVYMGAPYVPSDAASIEGMVKLAGIGQGTRVAELGSGDGRVVRALAERGAIVDGYEIQPFLVWWSRFRNRRAGLESTTNIFQKNLYSVDYGAYDVVVIYGFPNMMTKLGQKFKREMKSGSRVVSHAFTIPGWEAEKQVDKVYLYRI
jgi:cyclopropane fatty-acyl-phospholipid synthase-like methyltransferase